MTETSESRREATARKALSAEESPRFLAASWFSRNGIPPADVPSILSAMMAEGSLSSCGEGTFANRLALPSVHPNEMVAHFGLGTYASMHTVLGEAGIANNPSRTVYAVRQDGPDVGAPDIRLRNGLGEYRLLAMSREMMLAGPEEDRLEPGGRYPRATPERALCDWIWFSSSKGGRVMTLPPLDLDLSDIDRARLGRLADAMGISAPMAAWAARHEAASSDGDASDQVSDALGF